MGHRPRSEPYTGGPGSGTRENTGMLAHPVRAELFDLVREVGSITSNEASRRLGHSSGLCSFHLRQLARHGLLEEVPGAKGRTRPWRLRTPSATEPNAPESPPWGVVSPAQDGIGTLVRDLEDEGYRRWLARRAGAPAHWQRDLAESAVLHLTPDEVDEVAAELRALLRRYADREHRSGGPQDDVGAVAAVVRLFPLLPEAEHA